MLLFDLDGTLVDSSMVWVQIDIDFTARRGLPHTREYHDFVAHTTAPAAAQFTKEYYHLSESVEDILNEWSKQALEHYTHTVNCKPHVRAYLDQCRKRGESMAIVTSAVPELCRAVLQKNELTPYFSKLFFAEEIGLEKKDPDLFRAVAQELRVGPEECRLYDDSPVACRGAKSAGLQVIGVHDSVFAEAEPEMRHFCDGYIYDFSELLEENYSFVK